MTQKPKGFADARGAALHRLRPGHAAVLGLMLLLLGALWARAESFPDRSVPASTPRYPGLRVAPLRGLDDLPPRQIEKLSALERSAELIRRRLGPHGVSAKGIARAKRRRAEIAAKGLAAVAPDTLDVLVVLIDFETDRSGALTSVTEDGGFLCRPDSTLIFDPPPHDENFFRSHIEGLGRYWSSMSRGRLVVNARVYPPADPQSDRYPCNAISLSDIADYGPGEGGFWTIDRLVKLVQDMITATDQASLDDPQVNLADFDFDNPNAYVIFAHAGGDLQSNLVWQPGQEGYSPNDIPTFFVQLGDDDAVQLESVDSKTGTQGLMTECSVIPESTTQDGLLGSIAAAFYHEFGHALGLPDLYSTLTGLPTVGWWELMDSGTNLPAVVQLEVGGEPIQVTGLLPPGIGLWSKWFLGWVDPIRVGAQETSLSLPASYLQSRDDKGLLLDTGSDEFFLVENRWVPPFVPTGPLGGPAWALIRDPSTGVVLYLGRNTDDVRPENTHLYDFFLPWMGGAMVWRVREDLLEARIATNEVQGVTGDFALEIIESDGIQDIGHFDFRTIGFVGSDTDCFRAPGTYKDKLRDPPLIVEVDSTATAFTPSTVPSSESAMRVPTGASFFHLDRSDTLMSLTAFVRPSPLDEDSAFPVTLSPLVTADGVVPLRGDARSLCVLDDAGSGGVDAPRILVSASPSDGTPGAAVFAYTFAGRVTRVEGRLFALSAPTAGPISVLPLFQGRPAFALMTRDGVVEIRDTDLSDGASPLPGFPVSIADSLDAGPVILEEGSGIALVGVNLEHSRLHLVQEDGRIREDWTDWESGLGLTPSDTLRSTPVAADLDGDGRAESLVFVASGRLLGYGFSGSAPTRVLDLSTAGWLPPSGSSAFWNLTAWPEEDGSGPDRILLVFSDASPNGPDTTVLRAQRGDAGWEFTDFGEKMPRVVTGPAALGDLDGDGHRDVVLLDSERIWAFSGSHGASLRGYPIPLRDQFLVSPQERLVDEPKGSAVIADLDGDGLNELIFESRMGLLYALENDGRTARGFPLKLTGGGVVSPLVGDWLDGTRRHRALFFFEAEGDTVQQGGAIRNPRLQRFEVTPPPQVDPRNRPAEWKGLLGGVVRTGRAPAGVVPGGDGAVALEEFKPFVYPNPAGAQGLARVRFVSGSSQTAMASLMNLEGEIRYTTRKEIDGAGVSEIDLPIETLAAGAYLCRLEYTSPSGHEVEVIPFYIEN